ncbi:LacI family transcriptional regulator [Alloscardovia theropitheci]|uniref:LacI family transcriptional regulator n=1 Tax=Alloscardovia theropitheci TaxID=2496842 RepID=A0A4R0QWB5_9BIFI|nr:LacI family DNA-binding transcriptional regulator [Alloscardovia theropitheci]TCD53790.1 LacI family transcriptional regulator [Alloscardovia theropitheci]
MSKKKVSIVDVAHAAGVSYQTISRVINNSSSVREETRRRVLDAIETLDYHPSLSAQTLKTQRTRMIGVIASQTQYAGPLLTLAAIEKMARDHGLFVSLATVDEAHLSRNDFAQIEQSFIQLGVEAMVIVAPTENMLTLAAQPDSRVPRVLITAPEGIQSLDSRGFDEEKIKFVCTDQSQVSSDIASRLKHAGIRHVYYINGPEQWRDAYTRRSACERACKLHGLSVDIIDADDWVSSKSYEHLSRLIKEVGSDHLKNCTIWTANDLLGMGAYRAVQEAGLDIPKDVSIVGYDDMPGTESLMPAMTTVNPQYEKVGSVAMRLVLDMLSYKPVINNEAYEMQPEPIVSREFSYMYLVEPQLVIRESTRQER